MSYFPAIGNTTPGRLIGSGGGGSGPPPPASPIELDSLRLWLRGSDFTHENTTFGYPSMNGWSSKAANYPLNFTPLHSVPSRSVGTANGFNSVSFTGSKGLQSAFDNAELRQLTEITVIVVAKFTALRTGLNLATMYSRESASNPEFGFFVHPDLDGGKNRIGIATWSSGSKILQEIKSAGAMIPNQWQIFAVTAKTQAKFYVDGALITTASINNTMGSVGDPASRIYIGNHISLSNRSCDLIADVITYNKELTLEELDLIFDKLKERYAID